MTFNPSDPGYTKATEAMARAMYELRNGGYVWNEGNERTRDFYRADARAALAALEQEGLVLTDTREVERLRETLKGADLRIQVLRDACWEAGGPVVPVSVAVAIEGLREEQLRIREALLSVSVEGENRAYGEGDRLYYLLALFDTRDGSERADLVRAAHEGWERSGPDMTEADAWDEFDARWAKRESVEGEHAVSHELALVAALAHLADIHHCTITGSRLHDPERIEDFIDCPCRTCRFVTETLVAYADSREVQ